MYNFQAFGVQTLSGTGSLRVGAELLNKHLGYTNFYYSVPTWGMSNLISLLAVETAGFGLYWSRLWNTKKKLNALFTYYKVRNPLKRFYNKNVA